jgi:anti-sigma regulatory factor (Ser/Thr protein kinase)/GNAT superfamily N-acetyltransferase
VSNDQPTGAPWSRLTILNDTRYLPLALGFVRDFALLSGIGAHAAGRLELAVEEAVTNVIEHAFSPDEMASFDVVCGAVAGGVEVAVQDRGLPFDPTQVEEWQPRSVDDAASGHGLGAVLMRKLVNEFGYTNRGAQGKEIRLVVHADETPVGTTAGEEAGASGEGEEAEFEEAPAAASNATRPELTLRWMETAEAVDVARCVYDSYGYSYANENVYYPERLAGMNDQGTLRSAVAVTGTGEVAGHAALLIDSCQPPEVGMVATKKKFRGAGAASKLVTFLDEAGRESEYPGVQIKAVCVHPYTQIIARKMGFIPCGFLLAHSPKSLSFKGIAEQLDQRNTDVIGFKQLRCPVEFTVYPPERHRDMISSIYQRLGRPVTMAAGLKRRPAGETRLTVSMNPARALALFYLERCGADVLEQVLDAVRRARREEMRVLELFIHLSDPGVPWLAPRLEEHRFFFTGLLPGMSWGDALVMQHMEGVQVDYDGITTVEESTRELLDYVRRLDVE